MTLHEQPITDETLIVLMVTDAGRVEKVKESPLQLLFLSLLQCLSAADIFELHDTPAAGATDKEIPGMCGSILYQVNNPLCLEEKALPHKPPTKAESKISLQ